MVTNIQTISTGPIDEGKGNITTESPIHMYMCGNDFAISSKNLSQGDFLQVYTKVTNGIVNTKRINKLSLSKIKTMVINYL